MKMNPLGRTGMMVSEICLGTMTWGEQNTEAEAHEQMDYAPSQGVNFLRYRGNVLHPADAGGDTGPHRGISSEAGLRASGKRNDIILATKMTGDGMSWVRNGQALPGLGDGGGRRQPEAASDRPYRSLPAALAQPRLLPFPQALGVRRQPAGQGKAKDDIHETLRASATR
jgi:aryl-alcohol dehydrogenase-like predicted oxidoreductase